MNLIAKMLGGIATLKYRLAIGLAVAVLLFGWFQWNNYQQRKVGEKRLSDRLKADDLTTLEEKAKRDEKLRNSDDSSIIDILTGVQ